VATVGPGSASHLCMLNVQDQTGTQFQMVPYKGGEAVQDMMGGHVDLMCDQAGNSLALVRGGKLRALAVMGTARWFAAPDVPTSQEQGTPGLEIEFWYGLWAPKGTPGEIIAKLNAAVRTGLADPVVRERLTDFGIAPPTAEQLTPAYLAELQRAEIAKWWPRIKAANIKIE
jgi:tripartite-type tricarboxylate transporter receptor subunit TctC